MAKVPYEIWSPIRDGPVQIQVDENRGVIWVNSGKDGRCLIRICNIPNLEEMLLERTGPWMIDVRSIEDPRCCVICGYRPKNAPPWDRRDAGAFDFGGKKICGDCGDVLRSRE